MARELAGQFQLRVHQLRVHQQYLATTSGSCPGLPSLISFARRPFIFHAASEIFIYLFIYILAAYFAGRVFSCALQGRRVQVCARA